MIDYVIVHQRDIQDVLITRAMQGAECWTDHRLVCTTLELHIAQNHPKRPELIRTALNTAAFVPAHVSVQP